MTIEIGITDNLTNTQYAPLVAMSAHYHFNKRFKPLTRIKIPMRRRDFTSADKLIQILLSILAGCQTLSELNPKLRSEFGLAKIWGWDRIADQSSLSRTLDALTQKNIEQLRDSVTQIRRQHSQMMGRDWRSYLWLDFDLSGLPCSPRAEASQKGYFSDKKNTSGRQLARVSILDYQETVWSDAFPGNQHTVQCLEPAVLAAETALELSHQHRKRTVWRLDGGAGSDQHLRWLIGRGYHVVAKGMSHSRAKALANRAARWDTYQGVEVGEVEPPVDYGHPVRVFVKRISKNGGYIHSYHIMTISLASKGLFMACYDQRGAVEVEQFRSDKSGLGLEARRKASFLGQKGYILLTDLPHNLLSDFYYRALLGSRFSSYGPKRIIRDLLAMPGRLIFDQDSLVRVELLSQKQFSKDLAKCLKTFVSSY